MANPVLSPAHQIFLNLIFGIKFAEDGTTTKWIEFTLMTILVDLILWSPVKILCRWVMPLFMVTLCYVVFFFAVVGFAVICEGSLDEYAALCNFLPF